MRRKDRELTEINDLISVVNKCKVCRLAMLDDEIYIVPLNFGYEYCNDTLVLYFHSAKVGRKIDIIKTNNKVAIEMDCEHELIEADHACAYGYYYQSIIGNGKAYIVENNEEKIHGLKLLMKHQTGKDFEINENMCKKVTVFKVIVEKFSGKSHL